METFLPYKLNLAERNHDLSKLFTLGPFALVLHTITGEVLNKNAFPNTKFSHMYLTINNVYRGAKLPEKIFEDYKDKFNFLNLFGTLIKI